MAREVHRPDWLMEYQRSNAPVFLFFTLQWERTLYACHMNRIVNSPIYTSTEERNILPTKVNDSIIESFYIVHFWYAFCEVVGQYFWFLDFVFNLSFLAFLPKFWSSREPRIPDHFLLFSRGTHSKQKKRTQITRSGW